MSKKITRRKFINKTGSAALAGALVSQFGYNFALAANKDPVSLLLGSHMDYLQALAPKYSEQFGVTPSIETVTTPDLSVKLNSAYIARKSVGDAIFVTASEIAGLADKGWLHDLTDFVDSNLRPNGVMENSLTAATYKGKIYAAPITIGCPVLHWNKNLLKSAGLDTEAPADWHKTKNSWNTMIEYAKEINDPDNDIYGIVDAWAGTHSFWTFGALLQANGGSFLNSSLDPVMNSDAGIEALNIMIDLLHKDKIIDPATPTYTWVFDAFPSYNAGNRGFFLSWPFISGIANHSEDSAVQGMSGIAPLPALQSSASVDGSEFLAIPKYSDNPEGGKQFIEFALSLENQIVQGSTSPWAPSLDPALGHADVVKNIPFAGVIRDSYLYPVDGGFSADRNQWVEILSNEVSLAISQKKNAKDALNDAVNQINASRS
ncbi:MAG: hypothetical protein CFH16_00076 [Alphaproteobacteria bacterium MarineAlpha5_Bin6]|nr:MAG: hypothetical protein CFH17_00159 [Alphaproteobacteria bacterium MarineAlpha5_Bin7]PPR54899.1 MAG: hypothetical protein CFH16_00076 [Alphaproteobacteria bacterium MarineAlpha5_Bin6]|tara:strand:+ start:3637 stop:4932 length:1296 start_codon:yes stop_codon:yes gene_type:complete